MDQPLPSPDEILADLMVQAVDYGADGLDFECRDGEILVCAMAGNTGVGIARLQWASAEGAALLRRLCAARRRGLTIATSVGAFRLKITTYPNFGDPAYRVAFTPRPGK